MANENLREQIIEALRGGNVASKSMIAALLGIDVDSSPITDEHTDLSRTLDNLRFPHGRPSDLGVIDLALNKHGTADDRFVYYLREEEAELTEQGRLSAPYKVEGTTMMLAGREVGVGPKARKGW